VAWVAEHRVRTGTQPLVQGHALTGTLTNVSALTIGAASCLTTAPAPADVCIATDDPVLLQFADGSTLTVTNCTQDAAPTLPPDTPDAPGGLPSGGDPIVIGPVTIDPERQCGSIFGQEGCLSSLGL
jgi:hypothetical protein